MIDPLIEIQPTHEFIKSLCENDYFIRSILQITRTVSSESKGGRSLNEELSANLRLQMETQVAPKDLQNLNSAAKGLNITTKVSAPKQETIQIDDVIEEISAAMMELILKQTNQAYSASIQMQEEIQKVKAAVERITVRKSMDRSKQKQKTGEDTSMFFQQEEESSIELRKKLGTEDRMESLSFINSFVHENMCHSDEISEKINASISKVESSIEDRINTIEKEFTRRIEQVMKTIKHLISMIGQEGQKHGRNQGVNRFAEELQGNKGSPTKPHAKKNGLSPFIQTKQKASSVLVTPHKGDNLDVSQGILNKSQNRITAFFGFGSSGKK